MRKPVTSIGPDSARSEAGVADAAAGTNQPARPAEGKTTQPGNQRIDKWLWFARVVKSRTLANGLVTEGKVRLNRERIDKPSTTVKAGDVITVAAHSHVRVLKVLAPGTRRGPAAEAATLFEDLTPPPAAKNDLGPAPTGQRDAGSGRPTKRERRDTDRLRDHD